MSNDTAHAVIDRLQSNWGGSIVTDASELEYFSTDVYSQGKPLLAVLRPNDAQQLADAVKQLTEAGVAVIARGGGMSYTGGYTAAQSPAVLVDTGALDKIVEINLEDAYVVVEAGVTWRALKEALDAKGVRTPYFGPMSGSHATPSAAACRRARSSTAVPAMAARPTWCWACRWSPPMATFSPPARRLQPIPRRSSAGTART